MRLNYEASKAPIEDGTLDKSRLKFDFIYWRHGDGHSFVEAIAERASEADILTVECPYQPDEDDMVALTQINDHHDRYLRDDVAPEEKQRLVNYWQRVRERGDAGAWALGRSVQLARQKGPDKHYAPIDVYGNDETYLKLYANDRHTIAGLRQALERMDADSIREAQLKYLQGFGETCSYRNDVVCAQLLQLGNMACQLFPEKPIINISVTEGLIHSATSHVTHRLGYMTSRVFFGDRPSPPRGKVALSYSTRAVMTSVTPGRNPDVPIPAEWIDKSLLETLAISVHKLNLATAGDHSLSTMPKTEAAAIIDQVGKISKKRWRSQEYKWQQTDQLLRSSLRDYCIPQ